MTTTTVALPATSPGRTAPAGRRFPQVTLTAFITWAAAAVFVVVLLCILLSVIVSSFADVWRDTWWPQGLTTSWYGQAFGTSGFTTSIVNTFQVGVAVVLLALLIGVPAGYVLARKAFPFKSGLMLLLLLPIVLPVMTYATQLAALMYRLGLGGSLIGVILVNLVPILPLVILVTVPFVEQISPEIENAARVFGASRAALFRRVLLPLLTPGIVAAGILSLVRVLGSFELTFFVSNAKTQTLVVTIFGAMADPGGPPPSFTAAMTVFYMLIALIGLLISLRFSNPAQALARSHK